MSTSLGEALATTGTLPAYRGGSEDDDGLAGVTSDLRPEPDSDGSAAAAEPGPAEHQN